MQRPSPHLSVLTLIRLKCPHGHITGSPRVSSALPSALAILENGRTEMRNSIHFRAVYSRITGGQYNTGNCYHCVNQSFCYPHSPSSGRVGPEAKRFSSKSWPSVYNLTHAVSFRWLSPS